MKWISVKDRLPKVDKDNLWTRSVLAFGNDKYDVKNRRWIAIYCPQDNEWESVDCCRHTLIVTHWNELPDEPKDTE